MNDTFASARADILSRLETARARTGRAASATLVAACKTQPDEAIADALAAGQRVFGENRVQEAQGRWGRFATFRPDVELRLIGPLQTNKAAAAVALFDVIETLDRLKLAHAMAEAMQSQARWPRVLVQVNTGEEPQKAGVPPRDLADFLRDTEVQTGLSPVGLMCIPPADEPPGPHFALLAKLAARHGLGQVSMGMSGDYEIAARHGATHVRVGTALFGGRAPQAAISSASPG